MENLPVDFFVTSQAFTKTTYRDIYTAIDPKLPSNSQAGKVVVITGASKGLGRSAFVASFARAIPKGIVIVARSENSLQEVSKEIKEINSAIDVLAIPADILNPESITSMWEKVKVKFGHADVLVNNAGTFFGSGPVAEASQSKWWLDFESNVRGTFLATQGFLKLLGKDRKGTIINLTSGGATAVFPGNSSYFLSKLVALQLQAYVAAENPNITAVALHPGVLMTDMTVDVFKRFALDTPELVGGVGVWLATDNAAFLTGKYISANWSIEELVKRKEEIVSGGKLSVALVGKFGRDQFV